MAFFMDAEVTLGRKLLEIFYILTGLITIYTGVKNAQDKENPSRAETAFFWIILGNRHCIWTMDPGQGDRSPCHSDVYSGDIKESKCRKT